MRKIFAAISATAMLLGAVVGLTACGDDAHSHIWDGGEITTPATCTTEGVKTYKCTVEGCTESYTDSVEKLDHVFTGGWVKLDEEYHAKKCASCTATDSVNKVKHNFVEDTEKLEPSTCHSDGLKYYKCSDCGEETTETITERPAHDFDNGEWVSVDKEHHAKQCANCEAVDDNLIAHTWDDGEITTPPAFMQTGEKTYTCNLCGETKTEEVNAKTTTSFAEEFTTENQDGAWQYGKMADPWEDTRHFVECTDKTDDAWTADGVEIKAGWINANGETTIAYTSATETKLNVKVDFCGSGDNTLLAIRIYNVVDGKLTEKAFNNVKNEQGRQVVELEYDFKAGESFYFMFSNEKWDDSTSNPNGSLNITLTVVE